MDSLSSALPMLTAQALPQVMPPDGVQALSGAEFLQMLTSLGTGAVPGETVTSLLPGLPTELNITEFKRPEDEPDLPAEAALALQWLPLTQFIESGINQKPAEAAPVVPPGGGQSVLLQTAATATAATAVVSSSGQKTAPPAEPVAVTDAIAATEIPDEGPFDAAAFAATLADVESGAAGFNPADRPVAGIAGANSVSASAAAISAMQSGTERTQAPLSAGADQSVQAHIRAPVHSARWTQELGQRITMMAAAGQQNGTLSLTPENMGPLEIRINVSQDTANVWFGAQQADTRAALIDALPRLREMFAANGLSLGEANVSHETPRQDSEAARAFRGEGAGADDGGAREVSREVHRVSLGLIDTYA